MPVASIARPISPPSASISRTRCPLAVPPIAGLHGISATVSGDSVHRPTRQPSRAAAHAASQPAWPAPMTMTSKSTSVRHAHLPNAEPREDMPQQIVRRAASRDFLERLSRRAEIGQHQFLGRARRRARASARAERRRARRRRARDAARSRSPACRAAPRGRSAPRRSRSRSRRKPVARHRRHLDDAVAACAERLDRPRRRQIGLARDDEHRRGDASGHDAAIVVGERRDADRARPASAPRRRCACRARATPSASIASRRRRADRGVDERHGTPPMSTRSVSTSRVVPAMSRDDRARRAGQRVEQARLSRRSAARR